MISSIRQFPRAFWVLAGATFVTRFGVFVVPFLTLFLTGRGFTPADAGWAVAAYAGGAFFASAVGGWLADRIGRNVTMAASSLLGAGCMLLLSQAEAWGWIVALAGLAGFVSEAGHPASSALVQDLVPPEHRVAAFAVLRWAVNLGWAFGPAAAGFVAEHSYFWLFAGDAATSAIFGLVALFFLPRGRMAERTSSSWQPALASIRKNRPFLLLFGACIIVSFLFRQTTTTFTLLFEANGYPTHWCGMVLALNGAMICLMELPLTAATRGWPVRRTIAAGYLVMGGSCLLLLCPQSIGILTLFMVVFTIGEMFTFSRQQAYAASLAPDDMRGRYSGFLGFAWCLGNGGGATAGLRLFDLHADLLWILCAALGVVAAVLVGAPERRTSVIRGK